MKGASLAYDVYPGSGVARPNGRRHVHPRADRERARACLRISATVREPEVAGAWSPISFTASASTRTASAISTICTGRSRTRSASPTQSDSTSSPPKARAAAAARTAQRRGIGRVHALWLACVHRAAHHNDQETLVWLYDVHLLAGALDDDEPAQAKSRSPSAPASGASACARCCSHVIGSGRGIAPEVIAALEAAPANEPATVFLRPGMRKLDVLLDDVRVLPGWRPASDAAEGTPVPRRRHTCAARTRAGSSATADVAVPCGGSPAAQSKWIL